MLSTINSNAQCISTSVLLGTVTQRVRIRFTLSSVFVYEMTLREKISYHASTFLTCVCCVSGRARACTKVYVWKRYFHERMITVIFYELLNKVKHFSCLLDSMGILRVICNSR